MMPRLVDADALINDVTERYCKDCERRKGIKNGKQKVIYDIGDAPCRACAIDDMKDELENAPTVDAILIEWILNNERMPKDGKGHDAIMDMIEDWRNETD